ncbi:kanamycin nucleotidyltransferase C-terminal domain-containing protein [Paenibacillus sp. 1001270B_150601_E10]|uniref:kanamycin nucleotidyltransferase C-terminal domain-containing protein n=1 Tax=Paenibacillus sp. 1001270B_150601_E10 TaxID=2787079 RepID=UPI00189D7356|nr:kanamycin nucleotidyltransferase C-terminal domain-containing protein [Paenibacillus sp. 1001270B_150601_E10]
MTLSYPNQTTREEKLKHAHTVKELMLNRYDTAVIAIGIYGSLGAGTDLPYSDIEMHVIVDDTVEPKDFEFVWHHYKMEINLRSEQELLQDAKLVDEMWPITNGSLIRVMPLYDPRKYFERVKQQAILTMQQTEPFKNMVKQFMVHDLYETFGKIRGNMEVGNRSFIPLGAVDLVWEISVVIGLMNRQSFTTRARAIEEALNMPSLPAGYSDLAAQVLNGTLHDIDKIYASCERLWSGLNAWCEANGIHYRTEHVPLENMFK